MVWWWVCQCGGVCLVCLVVVLQVFECVGVCLVLSQCVGVHLVCVGVRQVCVGVHQVCVGVHVALSECIAVSLA